MGNTVAVLAPTATAVNAQSLVAQSKVVSTQLEHADCAGTITRRPSTVLVLVKLVVAPLLRKKSANNHVRSVVSIKRGTTAMFTELFLN
jgi:creatinine amidohydrolase/Fe(II)-dependent formamide hydrolase-like protein